MHHISVSRSTVRPFSSQTVGCQTNWMMVEADQPTTTEPSWFIPFARLSCPWLPRSTKPSTGLHVFARADPLVDPGNQ